MTKLSDSAKRYLLTIYRLTANGCQATTTDIADRLKVSTPSVSQKVRRLAEDGLVDFEWRGGISLTQVGAEIAVHLLRRHRLIETFLHQYLNYPLADIHAETCLMEHAVSDTFIQRIADLLQHPSRDPHGHPIPRADGSMPTVETVPLTTLPPQQAGRILTVSDADATALRHLCRLGLTPQTQLKLIDISTVDGTVTLQVGQRIVAIGQRLAETIGVVSLESIERM